MALLEQQDLFIGGEGGYFRYRIPALLTTPQGTLLAFCEGRRYTGSDSDQIDLMMCRSTDGGRTFSSPQVIATEPHWVCGNPAPVVDASTGTIWMLFCKNQEDGDEGMICEGKAPRTVWVMHSTDDGLTWSMPREITADVKSPEWTWYATGPGHGIQLRSGRLLVACDHIVARDMNRQDPYHSHIIFSDDHGATWRLGGVADEGTNESTPIETTDGHVQLNCRNKHHLPGDGGNYRAVAWSRDGGETLSPIVHDAALPEPICQASLCRYSSALAGGDRDRVLFSNPGGPPARRRVRMTVRLSYDECRTWPVENVLEPGFGAYSDLAVLPDGTICCLYETGNQGPYERLRLARFDLDWLTRGDDAAGR